MSIELKNVSVFKKEKYILSDVSFETKPGEIIGIVGENGAGKTTLMKAITGLIKFDGNVLLNNNPVKFGYVNHLNHIGSLIENPGLYPYMSGLKHLEIFSNNTNDPWIQTLINKFSLESFIDKPTKSYSLGMRQRLGIALAFLNSPDIILLDEPLNGLDPRSIILFRDFILEQKEFGKTILISSHMLNELQKISDRVIFISDGRIKYDRNISDIKNNSESIMLKTSDDKLSISALKNAGIGIKSTSPICINVEDINSPIQNIIDILNSLNISILDIQMSEGSIEESMSEYNN